MLQRRNGDTMQLDISLGWVDIAVELDLMCSEQFLSSVAIIANKYLFSSAYASAALGR